MFSPYTWGSKGGGRPSREPPSPDAPDITVGPADDGLGAILDLIAYPRGLITGSAFANWLQDPTIVKVMHNCYGDAALIYSGFRIILNKVWDTAVADCVLQVRHHNSARGLTAVVRDYTGHDLPKDWNFDTDGSFASRPWTERMVAYAIGK